MYFDEGKDSISLKIFSVSDDIYEKNEILIVLFGRSKISRVVPINTGIYGILYDNDPMPTASSSIDTDSILENLK